jgi:hypothetical protein
LPAPDYAVHKQRQPLTAALQGKLHVGQSD